MKELLKSSFVQNPEALKTLLATGNAKLTHKNKLGVEQDNGRFSKLLTEVRDELRSNQKVTKYPQITNFYNSLTAEQKKKINSLNELIRDYNQIPFEYSEEDFIEDLKCELRFKM
jgi:hypothetical protein